MTTKKQIQTTISHNKGIAATYIRISDPRQSAGFSEENQLEKAIIYAEERNLILKNNLIFKEEASASMPQNITIIEEREEENFYLRPKLQKLLIEAKENSFTDLIVFSRDRLSRNVEAALLIENILNRCGVTIHYTKPGETLNSDNTNINRLMHIILSSIAEFEGNIISIRVKDGNKACFEKGFWPGGKAPLGYSLSEIKISESKKNSKLSISNLDKIYIEEIFNLYLIGNGYINIAKIMNLKYPSIEWTKSKIEHIIKNQTYTGQIAWDRRGGRNNPKKHTTHYLAPMDKKLTIITDDIFDEVIDIRKKRASTCDPCMYTTPYLLKNILFCGTCNEKMIPKNPGRNKDNVYICKCKTKRDTNFRIRQDLVENYFLQHLSDLFSTKNKDKLEEHYEKYVNMLNSKKLEYEAAISELKDRMDDLEDYLAKLEFEIIKTKYQFVREAVHNQISLHKNIHSEYGNLKTYFENKIALPIPALDNYLSIREKLLTQIFSPSDESLHLKRRFILKFIERVDIFTNISTKQILDFKISFI